MPFVLIVNYNCYAYHVIQNILFVYYGNVMVMVQVPHMYVTYVRKYVMVARFFMYVWYITPAYTHS